MSADGGAGAKVLGMLSLAKSLQGKWDVLRTVQIDKRNETEAVGWGRAVMDFIHPSKNFGLGAIEWNTFESVRDMLRSM